MFIISSLIDFKNFFFQTRKISFQDLKILMISLAQYAELDTFPQRSFSCLERLIFTILKINAIVVQFQFLYGVYTYYGHDFLNFVNFLNTIVTCFFFGSFIFSFVNHKKLLAELIDWCECQGHGVQYQLISGLREKHQKLTEFLWTVSKVWLFSVNIASTTLVHGTGSVICSILIGEYVLNIPNIIPNVEIDNPWIFAFEILQPSAFLFYVAFVTAVIYLTFYYAVAYLHFRYDVIIKLYQVLGKDIVEHKKLNKELFKYIIDTDVDAKRTFEKLSTVVSRFTFIARSTAYIQAFMIWVYWNSDLDMRLYFMIGNLSVGETAEFSLFFVCNILTDKMQDAADAIWMEVPWYELKPHESKLFLTVMSQQVSELKAGGIYPLTLEGYKEMATDIYSQCTALQTLLQVFG